MFSQKAKHPLRHLSCTTGSVRGKVVSLYCVSSWIGFVHLGPRRGLVQTSCWWFSGHSANLDQSPVRALNQSHTNSYDASWRTFHWLLFKHFHIAWLVVHASNTCSNPLMHTVPGGVCGRILLGSPSYPRSSQRSWGINGDRRARKMPNWSDLKGKPCNSWYPKCRRLQHFQQRTYHSLQWLEVGSRWRLWIMVTLWHGSFARVCLQEHVSLTHRETGAEIQQVGVWTQSYYYPMAAFQGCMNGLPRSVSGSITSIRSL